MDELAEDAILECTFTKEQLGDYCAATTSDGAIHLDEQVAVPLFGGLVVPGALASESMFVAALENELWKADLTCTTLDLRFTKVILAGRRFRGIVRGPSTPDSLHLEGEVAEGIASVLDVATHS